MRVTHLYYEISVQTCKNVKVKLNLIMSEGLKAKFGEVSLLCHWKPTYKTVKTLAHHIFRTIKLNTKQKENYFLCAIVQVSYFLQTISCSTTCPCGCTERDNNIQVTYKYTKSAIYRKQFLGQDCTLHQEDLYSPAQAQIWSNPSTAYNLVQRWSSLIHDLWSRTTLTKQCPRVKCRLNP